MRLHEYEGADIFESMKIPVPRRGVAESVEDAAELAGEIGYPVILKAQVLVGGRGLAGGVKTADTPEVLEELAGELFEKEIKGLKVRKIMVSEKVDIETGIVHRDYHRRVFRQAGGGGQHRRGRQYRSGSGTIPR